MHYRHKEGITLRKLERSDLPDLLRLKAESWWGTHKTLIVNSDDQSHWYDNIPDNELFLVGELDGLLLGVAVYTDIDLYNRTLRIGGSLYPEHRDRKTALASFSAGLDFAFEILNMHRVEAEVLEYHVTAQKLEIENLGFTVEGRRRDAVYKCGRYYDSIMLGLLRQEWATHERVLAYGDTCNLDFSHDRFEKLMRRFSLANEEA